MRKTLAVAATAVAAVWLATAGAAQAAKGKSAEMKSAAVPFATAKCPDSVAAIARCHVARDENGAWVFAVIPQEWNKTLIVHAHGGPDLESPEIGQAVEDMQRFQVFVRHGYAWVSSTYRRGGYGVRMAAADVERSRVLFWSAFGKPERTVLHGQSYGGNVGAKVAELYALDAEGMQNYDGVMLTSGVLAGGTRAYGFRSDLRAVYQYYCHNLPAPGEAPYPLWQGLPADSPQTRAIVEERVNACTGVNVDASARSAEQTARLRSILAVTGITEKHLLNHMAFATLMFRDIVHKRLSGRNPFDNAHTVYHGSEDDAALNAGVERFTADPRAVAQLAYDADLTGLIVLPTITMHALHDPTIPFAVEADYARVVQGAGRSQLLVQTATDEHGHSKLAETQYLALLTALTDWISSGHRPEPEDIAARCRRLEPVAPGGCHFVPAP
jgi:hypothetical protein